MENAYPPNSECCIQLIWAFIGDRIINSFNAVKREAELKTKKSTSRRSVGIPHLQLFGQLSELKQYKVRNILANKIILAETVHTGQLVIFKTLHKSPAVFKKSKTSLLPINISYMVRLLKYFETDDCVYLICFYSNSKCNNLSNKTSCCFCEKPDTPASWHQNYFF